MLKENFKLYREELDNILLELEVPRILWHVLSDLKIFLHIQKFEHEKTERAVLLILILNGEIDEETISITA